MIMRTQYLITVLAVATLTTLTSGCSKSSSPQREADAAAARGKDLGVVELSDATPTRVDLGGGKECIITPRVISDNAVQLEMTVEAKDAAGNPMRVGSSRVTAKAGQPFSISVGDTIIAMTPTIKAN